MAASHLDGMSFWINYLRPPLLVVFHYQALNIYEVTADPFLFLAHSCLGCSIITAGHYFLIWATAQVLEKLKWTVEFLVPKLKI